MKLKNFVMVMFGKDTMVDPKESEVQCMSYFHEDRDSKGDEVICLETHRLTDFNFYIPFFCNWNVMVFHIFQSFISTLEKISKTSKDNISK